MSLRLARKGRKQKQREVQSDFDRELGEARRTRDEALAEANKEYGKAVQKAHEARGETRKAIYETYDAKRNDVVKRAADAAAKAA